MHIKNKYISTYIYSGEEVRDGEKRKKHYLVQNLFSYSFSVCLNAHNHTINI